MAHILVVDDAWVTRQTLKAILTQAGHEVIEAQNGHEAIEIIKSQSSLDVIFLDLLMPEMDGFETLAAIKEMNVRMPVVIHSSDIQESTRKKCMELGALAFFNKPVTAKELNRELPAILSAQRSSA